MDAQQALADGAPVIRDDKEGQTNNHIFDWESGDKDATDAVFAGADVIVSQDIFKIDPKEIEKVKVVMTIMDGRVVYEARPR
jgi:carbon-monoxide dehydrogenase large subunit